MASASMNSGVSAPSERLHVIALVSGGKDSFFSLLHCLANGHRVVALANLYPATTPPPGSSPATTAVLPGEQASGPAGTTSAHESGAGASEGFTDASKGLVVAAGGSGDDVDNDGDDEPDLNSFMYQTVGHQVIPLYADATGLPVYRHPIVGTASQHAREYADPATLSTAGHRAPESATDTDAAAAEHDHHHGSAPDETESMLPLLRAIKAAHPEANAVSAGAILSTYQRTRVESVAARLGLTPLAYLWKFPTLPPAAPSPSPSANTQLLRDLGAAGLQARIVKVASGGLDEGFLWADVGAPATAGRIASAMRRFGGGDGRGGAVLGEGGEFETLVLDGPPGLFGRRIEVAEGDRRVVREGGGSAWVNVRRARVVPKLVQGHGDGDGAGAGAAGASDGVRVPDLLDRRFADALAELSAAAEGSSTTPVARVHRQPSTWSSIASDRKLKRVATGSFKLSIPILAGPPANRPASFSDEAQAIVSKIRAELAARSLPPTAVVDTVVVLRRMDDFATFNHIYAPLFPHPNPPARVTIACGDRLPAGLNAAVSLSVLQHAATQDPRHGLHVQSRSYWAPANIGPYSQAVSAPASPAGGAARLVSVAGQIPLVPATMQLPSAGGLPLQLALSLQHLWRVGADVGVQRWGCAAAYLPRCGGEAAAGAASVLAGRAWRAAHLWVEGEGEGDEGEEGPDLWERKFDPRFRELGGAGGDAVPLPDPEAVEAPENARAGEDWKVPLVFVAEVAGLPRAAGVEWHAHVGFSGVTARSLRCWGPFPFVLDNGRDLGATQQTVLRAGGGQTFVLSVLALQSWSPLRGEEQSPRAELDRWVREGLERCTDGRWEGDDGAMMPEVVYVDGSLIHSNWDPWLDVYPTPVIPCVSLRDGLGVLGGAEGERMAAVFIYRTLLQEVDSGPS